MKVWEAIEMLKAMDGNKEVTVTMGKPKRPPLEFIPYPALYTIQPNWYYYTDNTFPPNTVTCKGH